MSLSQVQSLKPGDPCEFRWVSRDVWRKGEVVKNGGSGYWTVMLAEACEDEETGNLMRRGTIASSIFIEHVRLPSPKPDENGYILVAPGEWRRVSEKSEKTTRRVKVTMTNSGQIWGQKGRQTW